MLCVKETHNHAPRQSCLCIFEYCTMAMRDSVNHQSRMSIVYHCRVFSLSCPITMKIDAGKLTSLYFPPITEFNTPIIQRPSNYNQRSSELIQHAHSAKGSQNPLGARVFIAAMPRAPKIHLALELLGLDWYGGWRRGSAEPWIDYNCG